MLKVKHFFIVATIMTVVLIILSIIIPFLPETPLRVEFEKGLSQILGSIMFYISLVVLLAAIENRKWIPLIISVSGILSLIFFVIHHFASL